MYLVLQSLQTGRKKSHATNSFSGPRQLCRPGLVNYLKGKINYSVTVPRMHLWLCSQREEKHTILPLQNSDATEPASELAGAGGQ